MADCAEISSVRKKTTKKGVNQKKILAKKLLKVIKRNEHVTSRLKTKSKILENAYFQKNLKKMSNLAGIFLTLYSKKELLKRRKLFKLNENDNETVMSLGLYKMGPKCYKLLLNSFVSPHIETLNKLSIKSDIHNGFSMHIFETMLEKSSDLKYIDKYCVLTFTKLSLGRPRGLHQRKNLKCLNLSDYKKQRIIADRAYIFMLTSITRKFKLPLGFTFSCGKMKINEFAELITFIIKKIHSVRLRILAIACNANVENVQCINHLIAKTKEKYSKRNKEFEKQVFEIGGREIIPLYSAVHLIQDIRNNLLEKDLHCVIDSEHCIAQWDYFQKLLDVNKTPGSDLSLVQNFTKEHIDSEICKKEYSYAIELFSRSVAAGLNFFCRFDVLPKECQKMAQVILFFNKLFDSIHGGDLTDADVNPFVRPVTRKSKHKHFWREANDILNTIKFVKNGVESVPLSLVYWKQTVSNAEYLSDSLIYKYDVRSVFMRQFNLDSLESLIRTLTKHGKLSPNEFEEGFKLKFKLALNKQRPPLPCLASSFEYLSGLT